MTLPKLIRKNPQSIVRLSKVNLKTSKYSNSILNNKSVLLKEEYQIYCLTISHLSNNNSKSLLYRGDRSEGLLITRNTQML